MPDRGAAIEAREPTPADLPAIDELYRVVKGRSRPPGVTRHRFFDTPWGDSPSLVAFDGERCIAAAVVWPAALRIGDEIVLGGQGTDAATHPDYRSRPRLFLRLVRDLKEIVRAKGFAVYYTFPNERSIKLTRLIGGTYLGTVGAWGLELRGRRWFRRPAKDAAAIELTLEAPADIAELVAACHRGRDVIRVEKSDTWLRWRYAEATAERYEWALLRDAGGRLTAAALVGERDAAQWGPDFAGLLRIHELFATGGEECERLLRGVVAHASAVGARKLDVLVKDPVLERAVERAGLVRESERPITTIQLRPVPLDVFDLDRWRLISGDMDFF